MDAKRQKIGLLLSALALPAIASTQALPLSQSGDSGEAIVGGTPTTDFITLRAIGPGVPLRYGGVTPQSETVTLDGAALERGPDYTMDYDTGVVYLKRAQRAGQVLLVNYRYDAARAKLPARPFAGLAGYKFDLVPGGLSMHLGLSMAERGADGNVTTGNLVGWNNSFGFRGTGGLKGLMLLSQKQKVDSSSGFEYQAAPQQSGDSTSHLIVQSLESGLSGGKLKLDYQDVGRGFTGFSEALASGYDQKAVDQLAKEKGLKRMGFALDGMKLGSLSLSDNSRVIGDGKNKLSWDSFGLKQSGLDFNWQRRTIASGFTRFDDLSESDKAQLKNEAGLTREGLNALYGAKFGKLGFAESRIEDGSGQGIEKRQYTLDTSKLKFNFSEQAIDGGFTRFGSLAEADKAQWGREVGLRRQSMALEAALSANQPLKFSQSLVHSTAGDLFARDFSYVGKTWSLRHDERDVDRAFGSLGVLTGPEVDDHLKTIASMYGPDVKPANNDKNIFLATPGISRDYTQLAFQPSKGSKLTFDDMRLKGLSDGGEIEALRYESGRLTVSARKQTIGANFAEIGSLMNFEKARLGTIAGLDRTDFGLAMDLGKKRKFAFNSLIADTPVGGARRESASLTTDKLEVSASSRKVDAGFALAPQMIDGENNLLATLRGYADNEARIKWQLMPGFKIDAMFSNVSGLGINQDRLMRDVLMNWAPNKNTAFEVSHQEQHTDDPLSVLFANVTDRMMLFRDFGRLGKLRLTEVKQEYDNPQSATPSFEKHLMQYEVKLDAKTSLATEQSITQFENGTKEDVHSETLSTNLTKGSGVSVTDTTVDRDGTDKDEHKRGYGFWYTLPSGVKVSYGFARQLEGAQPGGYQTNLGISGGTVDGVKIGNSAYTVNEWDRSRTQATSNVSLSSAKPFKFGRITELSFNVGMDTAADYSNWLKENRLITLAGKYGANTFSYLYKGQMSPTGERGIDRGFQFSTDQSDKARFIGTFNYKVRTLPGDQQVMIRSYSLKARPVKNFELTHTLATHPETPQADAILGSIAQNVKSDKWKLDYKRNPNVTIGGSYDEAMANGIWSRTGGLTITLNAAKGSPFSFFYGGEESDTGGTRHTTNRYELRYDQKAGPNQKLSLMTGNVTYEHSLADGRSASGIVVRVDYQLKF